MITPEYVLVVMASVVAVMNPTTTIAVYIGLTRDVPSEECHKVIAKSMKISVLVLAFFAFTGQLLFLVFNVTLAAFKIAGGVILIRSAFTMLNPRNKEYSKEELENISVVPLAFPLTSGPGTITAVILLVSEASSLIEGSIVFMGILVGVAVSYFGMIHAHKMLKFLGEEGLHVITRLMSVIVLAIAVQFILSGIVETASTL